MTTLTCTKRAFSREAAKKYARRARRTRPRVVATKCGCGRWHLGEAR